MQIIDLSKKKILVTGASSGLGSDIAIYLSECGAQVVLVGRNQERLERTKEKMKQGDHILITCDLGKQEELSCIFIDAVKDGKKIDGLVHCAGIIPLTPLQTITRQSIDDCMSVNFYAFLELVRCFSKKKFRESKASIIEISSICSQYPGKCQTVYAASKAAANAAVQSLALELYKNGIRINAVLPGTLNTTGAANVTEKIGQEAIDRMLRPQIHGFVEPREVSTIVAFMLSELSSAITGRIIYADGGYINF